MVSIKNKNQFFLKFLQKIIAVINSKGSIKLK